MAQASLQAWEGGFLKKPLNGNSGVIVKERRTGFRGRKLSPSTNGDSHKFCKKSVNRKEKFKCISRNCKVSKIKDLINFKDFLGVII